MSQKKTRIQFIDIAKGIAMISIILGHLGNTAINRVVFTFHVPIFFLITGYFINTKDNIKTFAKKKARSLLIPYAVTCCVIIVLGTLEGTIWGSNMKDTALSWIFASFYGSGSTYSEPFPIKNIGAIWFLLASFWGGILFRFSLNLNAKIRPCFLAFMFLLGYITASKLFWFPFSIQAGACAALFMYIGFLVRQTKETLTTISSEAKFFSGCFAVIIWASFIKNFQSFWFVSCDFGRGITDIFGCLCACAIVLWISKQIEKYMPILAKFFIFWGQYSLLVLCIHITELKLFPWWILNNKMTATAFSANAQLAATIIIKFVIIGTLTWLFTKINFIRKIFGYQPQNKFI